MMAICVCSSGLGAHRLAESQTKMETYELKDELFILKRALLLLVCSLIIPHRVIAKV